MLRALVRYPSLEVLSAMTEMERVWARIKEHAHDLSLNGPRIQFVDAVTAILRIVHSEKAQRPPDEALEYLAGELMALVENRRDGAAS